MNKFIQHAKILNFMVILFLLPISCQFSSTPPQDPTPENLPVETSTIVSEPSVAAVATPTTLHLPLVQNTLPKFAGIIMPVYWSKENVEKFMPEADAIAGIKHASVGWGIDVQDPALKEPWQTEEALNRNNLYRQLEQLWLKGYVSFIKIGSSTTIREIADGHYDDRLNQMAQIYKRWLANGGGRKAMFAPFQEMNGEWVPYFTPGTAPAQKHTNYKDAYRHILDVFQKNGIDRSQVWWVFSPNGWSWPEDNFEFYYPGDDVVDLVGFASYNFGFCDATLKANGDDYGLWENHDRIYEPYIRRIEAMAPSKPIIIAETGTSGLTSKEARQLKQYDLAMKAAWFDLNYQYLAKQPKVIGIFYFDYNDLGNNVGCDLGIPRTNFSGYKNALTKSGYQYINGGALDQLIP